VIWVFQQSRDNKAFAGEIEERRREWRSQLAKRVRTLQAADGIDAASRQTAARHLEKQLKELDRMPQGELPERAQKVYESLRILADQHMPVIKLADTVFATENDRMENDPPLAVLFKRIGTGGTTLSNADYIYSVIKHRNPECHGLVEGLLGNDRVAALFTPVTLVTAAVRLTAATLGLSDHARIDKAQFSRLLRDGRFLNEFNSSIEENGRFSLCLKRLLGTLSYQDQPKGDIVRDIGLPKQALCLLDLPLLETLLCWLQAQSDRDRALGNDRPRLTRISHQGVEQGPLDLA
jgi:hypothetical protein